MFNLDFSNSFNFEELDKQSVDFTCSECNMELSARVAELKSEDGFVCTCGEVAWLLPEDVATFEKDVKGKMKEIFGT